MNTRTTLTVLFSTLRIAALLLLCVSASIGQERQAAFDSAGILFVIDKGMEHSLQLFPNNTYFVEAKLYAKPDSQFVVEVTEDSSHTITRMNIPWTNADRDSAEFKIAAYARKEHPELYINQEGRGAMMVGLMGLSLMAYGPSLPYVVGMTDPSQISGTYLLMGGASYLIGSNVTSKIEVTKGEATFASWGGILGYAHGAMLAYTFQGEQVDGKAAAGLGSLVSLAEFVGRYHIARNKKMTSGTASIITSCELYGGIDGLALSYLTDRRPDAHLVGASVLASSLGGYLVGDALGRDHSYSPGDASAVTIAMGLGATIPVANLLAGEVTDHTTLAASVIAGTAVGALLAHNATRNTGFTENQGLTLGLGTGAGTLMGLGFALIGKADGQSGILLASLGSLVGYAYTFVTLANSHSLTSEHSDTGSLQIQLNPSALLTSRNPDSQSALAGVRYTF